jgi:hypothetical protein
LAHPATPPVPGLHDRHGIVEVVAQDKANPLHRHGPPRVAAGATHLEHRDGTPFLWLGDTAWTAPGQADADDWRRYVADRSAKGYTVLQVSPASQGHINRAGHPPFVGPGVAQIEPAYWRNLTAMADEANRQGLVLWINGLGDPRWYHQPHPQVDLDRFVRHLGARLSGHQVIFSPNSDSDAGLATGPAAARARSGRNNA